MAWRKTILLVLLVQTPSVPVVAKANHDSKLSRSSQFKLWEKSQLLGYSFKRFDSPSLILCNQQCSRNQWCASTNFKLSSKRDGQGTCELNKHELFVVDGNINFGERDGVTLSVRLLDCPQGWVLFGRLCYLLLDTPTPEWNDAQSFCQTHGAHLPIMRSAGENNFMLSLVMSQPNGKVSGTWLGLTRRKPNGDFYWVDDTPLAGQFSAWADGEPNNNSENCVNIFMTGERQGKWNDCFCSEPATPPPVVLCQKEFL